MSSEKFLVHTIEVTRYSAIASATILFYDHLISLDREIALIWARNWSFLKGVFIWHRYFGLLCVIIEMTALLNNDVTQELCVKLLTHVEQLIQPSLNSCFFWFRWESIGFSTAMLTSELVLLLWIFVMYNRSKRVVALLGVLFAAEVAAVYTIIAKSLPAVLEHVPDTLFCSLESPPPFFSWYWIPILVYNTAILALFIFKGYQMFCFDRSKKLSSFMMVVYRNCMLNFAGMFASDVLCCIFWLKGEFALGQIPVVLALSFSITNATRLLLNIRQGYFSYLDDPNAVIHERPIKIVNLATTRNASSQGWMIELRELRWTGP